MMNFTRIERRGERRDVETETDRKIRKENVEKRWRIVKGTKR